MASCDYCGNTILFGGQKAGSLRFCNARCAGNGTMVVAAQQLPAAAVQEQVWAVHQGTCPQCKGPGPVDVHTSYRVWSALLLTRWSSQQRVSCRSCGVKAKLGDLAFSGVLGWWGFPWGLIITPVQVGRNLMGLIRPPEAGQPSAQLDEVVRNMIVAQALRRPSSAGAAPSPGGKP